MPRCNCRKGLGFFRLISLIDTLASMTGTLQVESFNRCVDKLVDNFDAEAI
jgi:hypothetical protein